MTNRERYQRTFGALHASPDTLEVLIMNEHKRKFRLSKLVVIGACLAALLATTAFAANEVTGGKLGAAVLYFINGEAREAELTDNGDGSYSFEMDGINGRLDEHSAEIHTDGDTGEDEEIQIIIPGDIMDGGNYESAPESAADSN